MDIGREQSGLSGGRHTCPWTTGHFRHLLAPLLHQPFRSNCIEVSVRASSRASDAPQGRTRPSDLRESTHCHVVVKSHLPGQTVADWLSSLLAGLGVPVQGELAGLLVLYSDNSCDRAHIDLHGHATAFYGWHWYLLAPATKIASRSFETSSNRQRSAF